jgi:UDP-glucose 4-epimerase
MQIAKMFGSKLKFLPARPGERYTSALTKFNLQNKVVQIFGRIKLQDYIEDVVKNS